MLARVDQPVPSPPRRASLPLNRIVHSLFRRPLAVAVIVAMVWSGGTAAEAKAAGQSSVVAVVNADPITRQALGDAVLQRYGSDVLDNMVNRYLIMQECQKRGIEVTTEEVRGEIDRLAKKFGLTMESYLQLLRDERNITPDQYSREIIWPMLALRRLVADQVEVTQEEFNRAFLAQYGEAVKCRMIMVEDETLAQQLQARGAAEPDRFANLAKQHSEDETSASVGGLIPPIRRYMGDSRLEGAAFALQEGQVSPVLEIGDQHIVLQAVRRLPATHPSPQALPSIREQIQDRIRDEKMRLAATDLFAKLQAEANVQKVLDDPQAQTQYPGVAAVINGQQIPISDVAAECIKRHGEEVLEGEINRKVLTQALAKRNMTVTRQDIDQEISRAAVSYGFVRSDGTADVEAWIENVLTDSQTTREIYELDAVWPTAALKKLVAGEVQLTQSDLQQGYESAFGPRVEVLAIVLSDQRTAQKVWEMARDNPTDAFFGELAQNYSIEPVSASNMGKVPPIRKYSGQPAIEKEAFAMKPGDLSGIIATADQYIILRCQGYTEPVVSDFEAVRPELQRDLLEKKTRLAMAARFDKLKENAEIDNFLAAAKELPRVAREKSSTR